MIRSLLSGFRSEPITSLADCACVAGVFLLATHGDVALRVLAAFAGWAP